MTPRYTADDVAAFILTRLGKIPRVELQELILHARAWSPVWDDRPLVRAAAPIGRQIRGRLKAGG